MPTLTIKGMPDALYQRLEGSADTTRRSLNGEVIARLEQALGVRPLDPDEMLADIQALRARRVPPLTDRTLREAKERGRA